MISILIPNRVEPRVQEVISEIEVLLNCEVIIVVDREAKGKGWAIREALSHAKGDIIAFLDGDMDIHPRMLLRLIPFICDYDIVVGKKQVRGILSRRLLTRLSRLYTRILFGLNIDTQTGIKLFRREALPSWDTNGFMYDLEILAQARLMGKSIIEIPVEANIERKMSTRSIYKCFCESIKIWSNQHDPRTSKRV